MTELDALRVQVADQVGAVARAMAALRQAWEKLPPPLKEEVGPSLLVQLADTLLCGEMDCPDCGRRMVLALSCEPCEATYLLEEDDAESA